MSIVKRLFIFVLIIASILPVSAQETDPVIIFRGKHHSFGKFTQKTPKKRVVFPFKNVGTSPLVIDHVTTHCSCTTVTYTKSPVKPGETGYVIVTYIGKDESGYRYGYFSRQVTVATNGKPQFIRLFIEGELIEE